LGGELGSDHRLEIEVFIQEFGVGLHTRVWSGSSYKSLEWYIGS
jgi:hypothetical protein